MNNTPNTIAATAAAPATCLPMDDDFLASMRIDQSYNSAATGVGVVKPLLTVPMRKPSKTEFFRTHPDHWMDCFSVELKEEREFYVVKPGIEEYISEFVERVRLRLCVTRQGVVLIWPLKLPKDDARGEMWRRSASESATLAETDWVRIAADMHLGAYQPYKATGALGEPRWPRETWPQILRIAVADRLIDRHDHPVVRQLLGQA